jgi:hypothetical protein
MKKKPKKPMAEKRENPFIVIKVFPKSGGVVIQTLHKGKKQISRLVRSDISFEQEKAIFSNGEFVEQLSTGIVNIKISGVRLAPG